MSAIDYLSTHGLRAKPEDGKLFVWPSEKLNDELRNWIRQHREAILAEVMERGLDAPLRDHEPTRSCVWRLLVGGKRLTYIDPMGLDEIQTRKLLVERFGDRLESMERRK